MFFLFVLQYHITEARLTGRLGAPHEYLLGASPEYLFAPTDPTGAGGRTRTAPRTYSVVSHTLGLHCAGDSYAPGIQTRKKSFLVWDSDEEPGALLMRSFPAALKWIHVS